MPQLSPSAMVSSLLGRWNQRSRVRRPDGVDDAHFGSFPDPSQHRGTQMVTDRRHQIVNEGRWRSQLPDLQAVPCSRCGGFGLSAAMARTSPEKKAISSSTFCSRVPSPPGVGRTRSEPKDIERRTGDHAPLY